MNSKKRLVAIAAIILLIILLILLAWFLLNKTPQPMVQTTVPQTVTTVPRQTATEPEVSVPETPGVVQGSLESLAKTFSERYGSYSSESDFANLKDLFSLMSSSMQQQTETFIEQAGSSTEYYGVTTRVLSVKTVSLNEESGAASLEISTQREESKGSPDQSEVRYQKLVLDYVLEGGVWKVDSANWQEL